MLSARITGHVDKDRARSTWLQDRAKPPTGKDRASLRSHKDRAKPVTRKDRARSQWRKDRARSQHVKDRAKPLIMLSFPCFMRQGSCHYEFSNVHGSVLIMLQGSCHSLRTHGLISGICDAATHLYCSNISN